jgi:hypothetical protein
MKWYKKLRRAKGIPDLDTKIRDFKLDYIDAKKTEGGFLQEGELLFLEAIRKDPSAWDLSKVRDQVYSQLWRTVWHEDDDHDDRTTLPLFAVAGVEVEPTLTFPDAGTPGNMRKVSCRWATARQALTRADLIEAKADQSYEKARLVRQIGENALARGSGDPTTLLYDVRDGISPRPRPRPSSPSPTPLPPTPIC